MSRDIVWQTGHVAKEGFVTTADGLGDGQEMGGRGDLIISDKLMPFDLQQLSSALYVEGLEGSDVNREESPGWCDIKQNKVTFTH